MNIPTKKLQSGFEMPVYGLGTWEMGGRKERDLNNNDDADIAAIRVAIDLGITHIDTAEIYADGYTEQLLGKAIRGCERSKLFLVSKVQAVNMGYENVLSSCKKSLECIGTPYLDLYLLHRYNPEFDLKRTMQALDELVAEGLVRNIGVANFSKERLAEAQGYTNNKIVCDQVHYNLEFREPERNGLVEYCQANDIFLVAWRPLGKGNLLGEVPLIAQEMSRKYDKTSAQIAINWLISQGNVLTLSKTRNVAHLHENLGALEWTMEEEDIERIRKEYPGQKDISDVVPLE